jgi:translocation protein SEC62
MSDQEQGPPGQSPNEPQGLPINIQGPNGERPTPEQIQQIQQQLAAAAAEQGISIQEYVGRLRAQAMEQQQQQMRAQQEAQAQQEQQQQQTPILPGPPKPEAIAVANWLKTQELKLRTVVHDEKRKDMFKGEIPTTTVMNSVLTPPSQASNPRPLLPRLPKSPLKEPSSARSQ